MNLLWTLACFQPEDGTAVGNPATASFTGVDIPADVELELAEVDVKYLALQECHGTTVAVRVDQVVDLLRDGAYGVDVGGGRWCGMSVGFGDGGVRLSGRTAQGTPFDVVLQPPERLRVAGRFKADGQNLLVTVLFDEVLDGAELDAVGGYVRQWPGDPLAEVWTERLPDSVLLVEDLDGDGFPDDEDPTLFDPWDDPDKPERGAEPQSSAGCDATGSAVGLAALFAGLALLFSRRH